MDATVVSWSRRAQRALALAALALLPRCASLQALDATAAPDARSGYVGLSASVQHSNLGKVGITLVDASGATAGTISLDVGRKRGVALIPLPPGIYRVARIRGFMPLSPPVTKALDPDSPLARPFILKPGVVVLLGELRGRTWTEGGIGVYTVHFAFQSVLVSQTTMLARLRQAYPAFADAPVECLWCAYEPPDPPEPAEDAPEP